MMGDDVDEVKIVMIGDDVGISNDLVLLKAVIVVIKIMIKNMMTTIIIITTITMTTTISSSDLSLVAPSPMVARTFTQSLPYRFTASVNRASCRGGE